MSALTNHFPGSRLTLSSDLLPLIGVAVVGRASAATTGLTCDAGVVDMGAAGTGGILGTEVGIVTFSGAAAGGGGGAAAGSAGFSAAGAGVPTGLLFITFQLNVTSKLQLKKNSKTKHFHQS